MVKSGMKLIYVDSDPAEPIWLPSIFLAGPTSRDDTPSWRPEAIAILAAVNFEGTVFIPECSDGQAKVDYDDQVEWEWRNLHAATVILFWVPRRLDVLPAFTTNVEFGRYVSIAPDRCVYGRPPESEKNRYLDWLYQKVTGRLPQIDLASAVKHAIALAANG